MTLPDEQVFTDQSCLCTTVVLKFEFHFIYAEICNSTFFFLQTRCTLLINLLGKHGNPLSKSEMSYLAKLVSY